MTADIAPAHDCGDHTIFIGHIHFMWPTTGRRSSITPATTACVSYTKDISPSLPEFW